MSRKSLLKTGAISDDYVSDCNVTQTYSHLACKQSLEHLAKLAKWFHNLRNGVETIVVSLVKFYYITLMKCVKILLILYINLTNFEESVMTSYFLSWRR